MEEAVEWLSCMKCVGGGGTHAQADNESPQNAHKAHTTLGFHALKKEMHKQTDVKKKKKKKGRSHSSVAADGLFASFLSKLGRRWAPSLQGILGAFGDTEGVKNRG